jgi:hypothetical protein
MVVAFFFAVVLFSSAFSLEIHVDPVNGDDTTGRGSLSKPLRTVLAARNALRARASVEGARFPLSWQTARLATVNIVACRTIMNLQIDDVQARSVSCCTLAFTPLSLWKAQ